jgi:hypothetical protein
MKCLLFCYFITFLYNFVYQRLYIKGNLLLLWMTLSFAAIKRYKKSTTETTFVQNIPVIDMF